MQTGNSTNKTQMAGFETTQQQQNEISESAYEYLLGEIMSLKYPARKGTDQNSYVMQKLDALGYDVGYR